MWLINTYKKEVFTTDRSLPYIIFKKKTDSVKDPLINVPLSTELIQFRFFNFFLIGETLTVVINCGVCKL